MPTPPTTALPQDPNPELSEAKAQVSELQARLRAVSAAYKQLQEDVKATKVRLERQAEFQRTMQRGESVAKMFDPLDNLKRSMDAIEDGDAKEGLKMVVSQFMGALEELGLEVLSPVGMPFDPNLHEALSVVPVAEAEQDGMVMGDKTYARRRHYASFVFTHQYACRGVVLVCQILSAYICFAQITELPMRN